MHGYGMVACVSLEIRGAWEHMENSWSKRREWLYYILCKNFKMRDLRNIEAGEWDLKTKASGTVDAGGEHFVCDAFIYLNQN